MPAPTETIEKNPFLKMTLQGMDDTGNEKPRELLIRRDRALVIWSRLIAFNGTREQVIISDAQNMLRNRPYETIYPVTPLLMPGTLTTAFTATGVRARINVDVCNSSAVATATCRIQHNVSGGGSFDWYPIGTPVPLGVPIRTGFKDLAPGDSITVSSSPANSCTAHVFVDRYNQTGDTP